MKRCGGLPLAIKALGGLLHLKKSEQEWKMIKDCEMWKVKDVLPSLRPSFTLFRFGTMFCVLFYFSKGFHHLQELISTYGWHYNISNGVEPRR